MIGFFVYPAVLLLVVSALDFTSKKAVGTAAGFLGLFGYLGRMVEGEGIGVAGPALWLERGASRSRRRNGSGNRTATVYVEVVAAPRRKKPAPRDRARPITAERRAEPAK